MDAGSCVFSPSLALGFPHALLKKQSWQKLHSGGSKGGRAMERGDIREWENGKQIRPGKGHGVLLQSRGEHNRLKKEWWERKHFILLSRVCKR